MGAADFAVPVLESLLEASYDVVGVYTRPDRRAGRGRKLAHAPVKAYALSLGLQVLQPPSLGSAEALDELESLRPDLIVVAAYGLLLPRRALDLPRRGCLNVHPSLLPAYRGPSPVASAILDGETATGVTVMRMDEGMDTGPTVAARRTAIGRRETAGELTARLFRMGADLLVETLPAWVAGEAAARPQDESLASVTKLLSREDGRIDWTESAERIALRVRAYDPWPGTFTEMDGKRLKVLEAAAAEADRGAPSPPSPSFPSPPHPSFPRTREPIPGEVLGLEDGRVGVACGSGALELRRVQLQGRRAVSAGEMVSGYPGFVGSRLG